MNHPETAVQGAEASIHSPASVLQLPQLSGIPTALAELPGEAQVSTEDLARLLGRCRKSIQRATRRGELPPPFRFLGRNVWRVETIREHFRAKQMEALKAARKREDSRKENGLPHY